MTDETKVIRVTNQDELDAALAAKPDDDTVIEIHADPGRFIEHVLVVRDSREHCVYACDYSHVVVAGTSRVTATDHSRVSAYGDAYVEAALSARVEWHDRSQGKARLYAEGYAFDNATVTTYAWMPFHATDNAQVTVRGAGRVVAHGDASVIAYDQAVVEMSDDVDVTAYGQVVVYSEGGEVYAHNHVTVYARYDTDVEGPATSVVHVLTPGVRVEGDVTVIQAAL